MIKLTGKILLAGFFILNVNIAVAIGPIHSEVKRLTEHIQEFITKGFIEEEESASLIASFIVRELHKLNGNQIHTVKMYALHILMWDRNNNCFMYFLPKHIVEKCNIPIPEPEPEPEINNKENTLTQTRFKVEPVSTTIILIVIYLFIFSVIST